MIKQLHLKILYNMPYIHVCPKWCISGWWPKCCAAEESTAAAAGKVSEDPEVALINGDNCDWDKWDA